MVNQIVVVMILTVFYVNQLTTVFTLFPATPNHRTVFRNQKLKSLQLICGEFGAYPQQPIETFDSPKFINMIGDTLNVNGSPLTSLSYDTVNSFMDEIPLTAGSVTIVATDKSYNKYDTSNLFVGIPFSIDDDFQGGLSSPGANINFKLMGSVKAGVDLST